MDPKLKAIIERINKKHGDGTIVLGSAINRDMVPRCTSGSLSLDIALGGGWPMNQWNEIVGDESSGKTAVALKTVAANQARDPNWNVVWFDAEGSYDKTWAAKLGVDNDRTAVVTHSGMEFVYDTALEFLAGRAVDAIVVDSLPALVPEREDDTSMEDIQVGLGALLTGKFFRKQGSASRRSLITEERPVLGVMINQYREKIGVMYGDPRTTPGGRGKNYYYVTRVEVRRDDWIEEKDRRYGQSIKARVFKNKTAVPHKVAVMDFYFDDLPPCKAGEYDLITEVTNTAVLQGVIRQSGGGIYRYGEGEKWKGRAKIYEALRADESLYRAVHDEVLGVVTKQPPKRRVTRRAR